MRYLSVTLVSVCLSCLLSLVTAEIPNSTSVMGGSFGTSTLRSAVERVFSRKKRYVILPPGSTIKFNSSLSKRLLALVPSGLTFVIEIAVYYPCPTSRLDLIPKRLRPPTRKPTPPKPTKYPLLICIPGSLICYKGKPATKAPKVQRIGEGPVQWVETHRPLPLNKWAKYETPAYEQRYKWTPAKEAKYEWQPSVNKWANNKWNKWDTSATQHYGNRWQANNGQQSDRKWWSGQNTTYWPQQSRWTRELLPNLNTEITKGGEQLNDDAEVVAKAMDEEEGESYEDVHRPVYKPMYFPDLEEFDTSKHYHSHRDRRQLFYHFEGFGKFLGLDMKSCILRAICDSKRLLMPPGYSMIHDILRLIFSFPTISGLKDEYSRVMQNDFETCDKYWRKKCSFSLLHWLMNPQKNSIL